MNRRHLALKTRLLQVSGSGSGGPGVLELDRLALEQVAQLVGLQPPAVAVAAVYEVLLDLEPASSSEEGGRVPPRSGRLDHVMILHLDGVPSVVRGDHDLVQ